MKPHHASTLHKMILVGLTAVGLSLAGIVSAATSDGWHPSAEHEEFELNYQLNYDNQTTVRNVWGWDGSWSDWQDCEDIHGDNSAPRGFFLSSITTKGSDWALIKCRTIDSDTGEFQSGYSVSDRFYSAGLYTGEESKTQTSMDELPVGIYNVTDNDAGFCFIFWQQPGGYIAEGSNSGVNGSGSATKCPHFAFTFSDDMESVNCDPGYVMTGMRLFHADRPDRDDGVEIQGIELRCTELTR